MAKAPVKKAAPVRKKAVAKKAVAKKAAPVRKKAVAKKAVAKKAVAKKAVAKKAAPIRKKVVAKKAVAKKAAPVRKKAVAKKAVAKKAAPSKVKKIEFNPTPTSSSADKSWLQREQELPVFLKEIKTESKKEPISTQGYAKKKSRKSIIVGFGSLLVLMGLTAFSISTQSSTSNKITENISSKPAVQKTPEAVSEVSATAEAAPEVVAPSPSPSKSASVAKSAKAILDTYAPRNFILNSAGQEINFSWIAPAKSSSVIGYELSVKKLGASDWVVISSVTPQQLLVSVELLSMDSSSQYRIASILDNGKLAFSKAVLDHAGTVV